MSKNKKVIDVISTFNLEPGKFYVLNIDYKEGVTSQQVVDACKNVMSILEEENIKCIFSVKPLEMTAVEIDEEKYNIYQGQINE